MPRGKRKAVAKKGSAPVPEGAETNDAEEPEIKKEEVTIEEEKATETEPVVDEPPAKKVKENDAAETVAAAAEAVAASGEEKDVEVKDAASVEVKDAASVEVKDAASVEVKDAASVEVKDAVSGEDKDITTGEGKDAAAAEAKDDDEEDLEDDKPPTLDSVLAKKTKYVPPIPCSAGLGVRLNPSNPQHFDHFLFQLMLFKSETGGFHVPKDDYPELYTWLQAVKRLYKQHMMSASNLKESGSLSRGMPLTIAQVKVLESLHIPLTSRGDDHWNRFFGLLKQYKARHGHALVPRLCEVPGLGDWVTDQRRQYKNWKQGQPTQLTKERRDKLTSIGFAWQVRNRPEWDVRYSELLDYKKVHGDCKVPQHYKENKALGKWVAKQREQFKLYNKGEHSFLTPYRLEKLDAIGFIWQIRNSLEGGEPMAAEEKNAVSKDDKKEKETKTSKGKKGKAAPKGKATVKKEEAAIEEAATHAPAEVAPAEAPPASDAPVVSEEMNVATAEEIKPVETCTV